MGTVREWHREEGWGVIASPEAPGGCWVHFADLWNDGIPPAGPGEVVEVSGGFREAFAGETVDFEWEPTSIPGGQDGFSFRTITARPRGRPAPRRVVRRYPASDRPSEIGLEIGRQPD